MYCWKCGSQIREGSAFCPMCGVVQNAEVKGPKVNLEFGFDDSASRKKQSAQAGEAGDTQTETNQDAPTVGSMNARPSGTQTSSTAGNADYKAWDNYQDDAPDGAGTDNYNAGAGYESDAGYDPGSDYGYGETGRQRAHRETAYESAKKARKSAPREPRAPRTPRPPRNPDAAAGIVKYIEMGAAAIGFVFLVPFLLGVLKGIFRWIGYQLRLKLIWDLGGFFGILATILVWVILIGAVAVLAGLIYLLITKQGQDLIPLVVGIVVSGLIFLNSILYLTGVVFVLRVILVLAAAVLGLDLFVKVFLEKRGLTGGFNLADDFAMLREAFKSTDEPVEQQRYTNPNIPQYELTPEIENGESFFDGKGVELFGLQILLGLVSVVTCSLATPWILVKKLKWETSHTVIEGKRQSFNGTATELFGHWIKWFLLSLVTCGLYLYYAHIDYMKWLTKHTTYVGMEMPDGNEYRNSYFDGNFAEYIGTGVLSSILTTVTCGIGYPWAFTMKQKYDVKGMVVGGDRYFYDGTGGGLFGVWIVNALLTTITCGIYTAWAECALNRYFVCHTHIDAMNSPRRN